MYKINEINLDILESIKKNNKFEDNIFMTKEWLSFLESNGKGKSIILEISKDKKVIGLFIGLIFKKFGFRILGSPFEGWATCNMGFLANQDINKIELIDYIKEYAFKNLKCTHLEIVDNSLNYSEFSKYKYKCLPQKTYILDIDKTDEELLKSFKANGRKCIRQFERRGATIEKVNPSEEFGNEYYEQLIDVFKKQNLKPNYDRKKVLDLMYAFKDKPNELLCLKVCDPDGKCIATSIFPGDKSRCYFWGGASLREYQNYRPNEYMMWYAIKYWRQKGAKKMDMVGIRSYKEKFGPILEIYPRVIISKHFVFIMMRNMAKKTIQIYRKSRGV